MSICEQEGVISPEGLATQLQGRVCYRENLGEQLTVLEEYLEKARRKV